MAVEFAEWREWNRTRGDGKLKRWRRGTRFRDFSFEFEFEFDDLDIDIGFLLVGIINGYMMVVVSIIDY